MVFCRFLTAAAIAAGLMPFSAEATIWAHGVRIQPFQVNDNEAHVLPLNDRGQHELTWSYGQTRIRDGVVVSYSANCLGQGTLAYIVITILIDGRPADPTGAGDAVLCTASGLPVPVTRIGYAHVKRTKLNHTVRIVATGVNTTSWQVTDALLVIQDE